MAYMTTLLKSLLSLMLLQGSNYLITLLSLPYLSRALGVEAFGIYGLVISISLYFVVFTDFGFNLSATKKVAEVQNDIEKLSLCFFETLLAKFFLFFISTFFILILVFFKPTGIFHKELIYSIIMIFGTAILPMWFFQGIEKIPVLTIAMILAKILSLILFVMFVKNASNVGYAVAIQSSVNVFVGIFSLLYIYKYKLVRWVSYKRLRVFSGIRDAWPIFVATFSASMYTMSTPVIIGFMSTATEVGLFSAADRIKAAILGIFLILGNAFYPRINKLLCDNKKEAYSLIKKIFIFQGAFCLILVIGVFAFSSEIVKVIYGSKYIGVTTILMVLSPTFFLMIQSAALSNYILLTHSYKKEYTILPLISASVHIPMCIYLSYIYGALGGAVSILIVESISFLLLNYIVLKKKLMAAIFLSK